MRVGVDVGGTFTDFVFVADDGAVTYHKVPSTPHDPAQAILQGLQILEGKTVAELVHGSTVATNAVLERKGARTALLTTKGFGDVLLIGRQVRPSLYDIDVPLPQPLVDAANVVEVDERWDGNGTLLRPLQAESVQQVAAAVERLGVESVAICFLFSYAHPEHEKRVAEALAGRGWNLSLSSQIVAEYREYERAATTCVNAYVAPVMDRYLQHLEQSLNTKSFRIMQSNGGSMSSGEARRRPVHTILSGPAGGVAGAARVGQMAGFDRFVTFDMGGTSTDVALHDGQVGVTSEGSVEGLPLRVPMVDIHTVGAGGGSLAHIGAGRALLVGPESAGAVPGPACYGRGGRRATVTDANLVLGRLAPDRFLGGHMRLDVEAARRAVQDLAKEAGVSLEEAAAGVVRVVNSNMERAIRVISVERGHDVREFALFCFGGAGGLHAVDLATALGMRRVIVPTSPGTLSAFGVLNADVIQDMSRTVLGEDENTVEAVLQTLENEGRGILRDEGFALDALRVTRAVDVRYAGQSYEIAVEFAPGFADAFHRRHARLFGHSDVAAAVEVVNARASLVLPTPPLSLPRQGAGSEVASAMTSQRAWFGSWMEVPVYDRDLLRAGNRLSGPAIVVEFTSTTVVPPGWSGHVDEWSNLILQP